MAEILQISYSGFVFCFVFIRRADWWRIFGSQRCGFFSLCSRLQNHGGREMKRREREREVDPFESNREGGMAPFLIFGFILHAHGILPFLNWRIQAPFFFYKTSYNMLLTIQRWPYRDTGIWGLSICWQFLQFHLLCILFIRCVISHS